MSDIDKVLADLKQIFEAEYARGAKDALKRVMEVANTGGIGRRAGGRPRKSAKGRVPKAAPRRRAPRGAPRALVERVLKSNKAASASEIAAAAGNPIERSVSASAIRLELNRGKKERRYRVTKGKWSVTGG
jgi:hypothetical protein